MQKAKRTAPKRQALLVVGAHRSGSSAVSGMLGMLGAQPPRSLMPPTKDNPKGYWESVALMGFHDGILASAASAWNDWDGFNPAWMDSPASREFLGKLPSILEEEYGQAALMLIKDPRISRLLPIWLRVLADLDIEPKFVVPLRHPLEVARSMGLRDEFGRHQSQLIWLRHMLDAEFGSRGYDRVFVDYGDLLADWRSQAARIGEALDISWPRWSGSSQAEIDAFLTAGLRHHTAPDTHAGDLELGGWPMGAYRSLRLLAASAPDSREAMETLDGIREELNRSGAIYAPLAHEVERRLVAKLGVIQEALDDSTRHCDAVVREYEQYRHAQDEALSSKDAELAAERERMQSENASAERARAAEISMLAEKHEERVAELQAEVDALRAKVDEQAASRRHFESEIGARHTEELERAGAEKARVERALHDRFDEITKLSVMVIELQESVASGREELGKLQFQGRASEEKIKALEHERLERETMLRALEQELRLHRAIVSEQREEIRAIRQSRAWRAAAWLRNVVRPAGRSIKQDVVVGDDVLIRDSGLFDSAWYLRRYPDVRKKGMDPLKHYLRYGASEGRDPGPTFSTKDYLRRYPDVAGSGMNPLLHYARHGLKEGRSARPGKVRGGA